MSRHLPVLLLIAAGCEHAGTIPPRVEQPTAAEAPATESSSTAPDDPAPPAPAARSARPLAPAPAAAPVAPIYLEQRRMTRAGPKWPRPPVVKQPVVNQPPVTEDATKDATKDVTKDAK